MTYVLLPNSGQSLGVTRPQIRQNFVEIQNSFDQNHYDFNVSDAGKHSVIQLPEQTVFPATPVNEGQLLSRQYNTKTELAWRPENTLAGGDQYILSGMPIRAAARFNPSGANGVKALIGLSFNVTSVVKTSSDYVITFTSTFPAGAASANYLVIPFVSSGGVTTPRASVDPALITTTNFTLNLIGISLDFCSFIVLGG